VTAPEGAEHTARRLVETAVYVPIGLAAVAAEQLPTWVESRRQQFEQRVVLSRIIGKLVVDQGLRDLRRRFDARSSQSATPPAPSAASSAAPVVTTTAAVVAPVPDVVPVPAAEAPPTAPPLRPLPIEGYDSLAAPQVLDRLDGLDAEELATVAAHERSHRHRRTILGRIAQLAPEA
jgi:hypothetical protein